MITKMLNNNMFNMIHAWLRNIKQAHNDKRKSAMLADLRRQAVARINVVRDGGVDYITYDEVVVYDTEGASKDAVLDALHYMRTNYVKHYMERYYGKCEEKGEVESAK